MSARASGRYVIQHHTGHGPEHWDLMLEDGDVLATWRLERPPSTDDDRPIPAVRIADHRKAFLTFEGPTRTGRGCVAIHRDGTFQTLHRTDDAWAFELQGDQLGGAFILERSEGHGDPPDRWVLRPQRR